MLTIIIWVKYQGPAYQSNKIIMNGTI